MDRIDSHTPYDDESVERAYQVTMACGYHSAEELFNRISKQINSIPGGFVPTSTKDMAERLRINDIDELPVDQEYSFIREDVRPTGHDFRVYITSFQDGEGGDYAYRVDVWETDYCGHIDEVKNNHLFDPSEWHKGLTPHTKNETTQQ